ncbi:DnaD domain protein [Dellaglioa algida]|uniref:DnaD domain protein n=1 Tax=Dellaglioa algida TaxID=105612 RepID=UPI0024C492AC|nr:DnaD domain protein [Dellaglioa algida]MDK1716608.1 DnaD domain protein [Dellaglioa algida]MDK1721550.1 DnaD domain protein [Dellaglioa algida]
MNYLSQLLAFRDYQLFETKLSSGQIALWHALMQINNKCAWIEWFTTTNQMLETLSGLSRSGINKNRNVLKQLGLIDFRSNGKKATSYKVFKLYTSDSTQESVQDNIHTSDSAQRSTQQGVQGSVQQGGTLIKHKEKRKEKQITIVGSLRDVVDFYEQNGFGIMSPFTLEKITKWIEDFKDIESPEPEKLIIKALEISVDSNVHNWGYAEAILKGWETKKLLTVKDIEIAQKNYKSKAKPMGKVIKKEHLPDWAKDDYEPPEETSTVDKAALQKQLDEFNKTSPKEK